MIGKRHWAIPEGYIPDGSTGSEPEMVSHETLCILNTTDEEAAVAVTVFFPDREPAGPFKKTVPAKRTKHFRFNDFEDPEELPKGEPFASVIVSDTPIVCQHTRLDSRQAENALLTTIAYPGER